MGSKKKRQLIWDLLRIRRAAEASEDGHRCTVAPDPRLSEIIKKELSRMKKPSLEKMAGMLRVRQPSRVGFNDGLIYPGSRFPLGTSANRVRSAAANRAPLSGTVRIVVVLAEFPDKAMTQSKQHFEDLFFSQGVLANGSVREYFDNVSNGIIDIQGQVLGPYQLPQNLVTYANGESGIGNASPNARTMAKDALEAADPDVDYSQYDNDGDGYVDAFLVVHAGSGAESTGSANDIWSHKWVLEGGTYNTDGIDLYAYLTVPEDARIGVCCHELGHLLFGFPDLYDTDQSSEGVGNWCLMGGGSWNGGGDIPANPSAWCKADQGWVNVINVTSNSTITFQDVKTSHAVHRLWKNGTSGSEYFLVENRQKVGFDADLPGEGLLIWHIDDDISSNADEAHYKVACEQADGNNNLENGDNRGDDGDPFPGSSNNTTFDANSNPNSKSYGDMETCVSIKSISASGPIMTAYVSVDCGTKSLIKDVVDKNIDKRRKEHIKEKESMRDKDLRKEYYKELRKEIYKEKYEKEVFSDKKSDKPDIDKGVSYDKGFSDGKYTDGKYTDGKFGDGKFGDGGFDFHAGIGQDPGMCQQGEEGAIEPFIGSELRPDLSKGALSGEDDVQLIQKKVQGQVSRAKRSFDTKSRDA